MISAIIGYEERILSELIYGQLQAVKNGVISPKDLIWGVAVPKNRSALRSILDKNGLHEIIEQLEELSALQELDNVKFEITVEKFICRVSEIMKSKLIKDSGYIIIN